MFTNDTRKIRGIQDQLDFLDDVVAALNSTSSAMVKLSNTNAWLLQD